MTALAIDLGASGGKVIAGRLDGERLVTREVHRFPNDPVRVAGRLHWDILRLLHETIAGIRAGRQAGLGAPESLAIDTWGCDFGLLDRHGELAGNPYHYRDEGSLGAMAEVLRIVPREEIFRRTGCQFMPVNTLYQLFAMRRAGSTALERAETLLMIPDLLRYLLTGERTSEYTNATTTQFLAIESGDWDRELLRRLDLPDALLTPIVPPASVGGDLLPGIAAETGGGPVRVMVVGSHDTASAVAATPAEGEFAYLSSGTWSLLGTELPRPIVDGQALAWNFTNEGGLAGTYRLLRNIMGLWLVEGCRRIWAREGRWPGYEAMAEATLAAPPFLAVIDPDAPRFLNPPDMPAEVAAFCRETGQRVPETPGEIMRVVLEGLACAYRLVLERTERLSGRRFAGLHVVGGGTNNTVLQQFTANAIGRPVWAGPTEATAIGNLLAQFIARGEIANLAEGRALVRASFPIRTYEPAETAAWDEAFARYLAVRAAG
ncbi:MAG: rhamnulokinase [Thermomicrobiales bacterium]|nr:rhamnulokinase [Thermomicrobiales bacterium]